MEKDGKMPSVQDPNGGLADKGLAMGYNSPAYRRAGFACSFHKVVGWERIGENHKVIQSRQFAGLDK